MIKKIVSIILTFTIVLSISSSYAYASSSNKVITFEEYYFAMKTAYAQYGISYEILSPNTNVTLTKGLLDKQLAIAKQDGKQYIADKAAEDKKIRDFKKSATIIQDNGIRPMIMYVTKTYYSYQTVTSPSKMGKAQVCLEAQATCDGDIGRFLWANYGKCYQSGAYVNLKSWTVDSSSCFLYTFPGSTVKMLALFVNGTLTVEYTEDNTGLQVGYSSQHSLNCLWAY